MLFHRPYVHRLLAVILCLSLLAVVLPPVHATRPAQTRIDSPDKLATTNQNEEKRPWLAPLPFQDTTTESMLIHITENGFDPATVTFFGPTEITWLNTTAVTQTLKSGTPPPVTESYTIYLPIIQGGTQTSTATSTTLQPAIQTDGPETFTTILSPGASYTRRFVSPGDYAFYLTTASRPSGKITITGTALMRSSPTNGESEVAVTRKTILEFSSPLDATTVTTATFAARFSGQPLAARVHLSADQQRVTLFYQAPLPASARIRLTVDGNQLKDSQGALVDVDGDRQPGGIATIDFDTLSLSRIPDTHVWGYVYDSYNKNPDGSDRPVVGATIRVDGFPEANTLTNENGYFILRDMPAPVFFVHIDGTTATNAPPGTMYPSVGKPFHSVPGQSVQLIMDGLPFHVYLPPMAMDDIQPLSPSAATNVGFGPAGRATLAAMMPEVDPELWDLTQVTFAPNGAVDETGKPATQAVIIPVPPDRIPAPLAPGLTLPLVISIQAVGATNFDVPAPVCFPNLPDAETGVLLPANGKSALFSFNHDTGYWEMVGPMTVSGDGRMVCTDPGMGVRAPGWHGTQPGVGASGGSIVGSDSDSDSGGCKNVDAPCEVIIQGTTTVKAGELATYTAVGDATEFLWSGGTAAGATNERTYMTRFATPGMQSVTVTAICHFMYCEGGEGDIPGMDSFAVEVTEPDCSVTIDGPTKVKKGEQATFSALGDPVGGSYDWRGGEPAGRTTDSAYTASFPEPGITTVSVTYGCPNEGGGADTESVEVEVLDCSTPSNVALFQTILFTAMQPENEECQSVEEIKIEGPELVEAGEEVTYQAIPFPSECEGGTYEWEGGEPTGPMNEQTYSTIFTSTGTEAINVMYTCPVQEVTLDDSLSVDVVEKEVGTSGLRGDIVEVNLPNLLLSAEDGSYSDFALIETSILGPTRRGIVAQLDSADDRLATEGIFYLVPTRIGIEYVYIEASKEINSISVRVPIAVRIQIQDGYSTSGPNAVTFGPTKLDRYRQQQRLNYLGFPDDDGKQLTVDGIVVDDAANDPTKWAIGLFNAAAIDRTLNFNNANLRANNFNEDGKLFINATNAPRWREVPARGIGWRNGDQLTENNDWGTSWAISAIEQAGINNFSGRDIETNDLSRKQGGDNGHGEHKAGMDIDVKLVPPGGGIWYIITSVVPRLNSDSDFWIAVVNAIPGDAIETPQQARAEVAEGGNFSSNYKENNVPNSSVNRLDTTIDNLYNHRGTGSAFDVAIRNRAPGGQQPNESAEQQFDRGFDNLISPRANYDRTATVAQIGAFTGSFISSTLVKRIIYNDPVAKRLVNENYGFPLELIKGHADHFHVDIRPPTIIFSNEATSQHLSVSNPEADLLPNTTWSNATATAHSFASLSTIESLNTDWVNIFTQPESSTNLLLPQLGLHYFAIIDLDRHQIVQRGIAGSNGVAHDRLILAPNRSYAELILQATTLRVGTIWYTTPESGSTFEIPTIQLTVLSDMPPVTDEEYYEEDPLSPPRLSLDTDGDGLHNLGELVIGTDLSNPDTDGDGLLDGPEVQQGTNPLDGIPIHTSIIATVDTPGTAVDICVLDTLAAVADSEAGVALFNMLNETSPTGLAQLDTPGNSQRISCGTTTASQPILAVADGPAGVAILDISDPTTARILHQIDPGQPVEWDSVRAVRVHGDVVYAGTNNGQLAAIDATSGAILARSQASGSVRDIAIHDEYLYVLTAEKLDVFAPTTLTRLHSVDSSLVNADNRRLFVDGVTAYAVHNKGYNAFNLINPAQPALITASNTEQFGWKQIVPNGSNLLITAVDANSSLSDGLHDILLYNVTYPTQTISFSAQLPTPGVARAVALHNGLAYIADHAAGMHVMNYLASDTQGQAPTIALRTNAINGAVVEGRWLHLDTSITEDVQVRQVQFYVDGNLVATDGAYPFTHRLFVPLLAQQSTLVLRARAVDTGGNEAWSEETQLTIVADNSAPQVIHFTPYEGEQAARNSIQTITVHFDEPLEAASINNDAFQLFAAGADGVTGTADDQVVNDGLVGYNESMNALFFTVSTPLPLGTYQAVVASTIRNRAGQTLGNEVRWNFEIVPKQAVFWTNVNGGLWSDGNNWSTKTPPAPEDDVYITLPGNYTITPPDHTELDKRVLGVGTLTLGAGAGAQTLDLTKYTLHLNGSSLIQPGGKLSMTDSTITGTGTIRNEGSLIVLRSKVALDIENAGILELIEQPTRLLGQVVNEVDGKLFGISRREGPNGPLQVEIAQLTNHGLLEIRPNATSSSPVDAMLVVRAPLVNSTTGRIHSMRAQLNRNARSILRAAVENQGYIDVIGPLVIEHSNSVHQNSGTIHVNQANLTFNGGAIESSGTIQINGVQSLFFQNRARLSLSGTITGSGTLDMQRSELTVEQDLDLQEARLSLSESIVRGSGRLTNSNFLKVRRSTIEIDLVNKGTLELSEKPTRLLGQVTNEENAHILAVSTNDSQTGVLLVEIAQLSNYGLLEIGDKGVCCNPIDPTIVVTGTLMNGITGIIRGSTARSILRANIENQGRVETNRTLTIIGTRFANLSDGAVAGTGSLDIGNTTYTNAGAISPGMPADNVPLGKFTLLGTLPMETTAKLNIEIGGKNAGSTHDQLVVRGTATLSGTLNLTLVNGYTPTIGDTFVILTSSTCNGEFGIINGISIDDSKQFRVIYNPNNVTLEVVAAP